MQHIYSLEIAAENILNEIKTTITIVASIDKCENYEKNENDRKTQVS